MSHGSDEQPPVIDWDVPLPREARVRREMFARYGAAIYRAQTVEKQLAILLATTFEPGFLEADEATRESYFVREFKRTLGTLVSTLGARVDVSASMEAKLVQARDLRNRLAHEYFWERATDMLSVDGCEAMIAELQVAADWLADVDADLTSVTEAWLQDQGIDPEQLEAEYARHLSSHRDE